MALTANAAIRSKGAGDIINYFVAASAVIYRNAIVAIHTDGYLRALVAGDQRAGIAREAADNTGGADGAIQCEVYNEGIFRLPAGAAVTLTQAMVGELMYAVDDQSISNVAGGNTLLGPLVEFESATVGWVKLMGVEVVS